MLWSLNNMQGLNILEWIPGRWKIEIFQILSHEYCSKSVVSLCFYSCWTLYIWSICLKEQLHTLYSMLRILNNMPAQNILEWISRWWNQTVQILSHYYRFQKYCFSLFLLLLNTLYLINIYKRTVAYCISCFEV